MKIKIGQEQISYLNSLDNTELKKEFLMDYFISQCEEIVKKEEESVTKTKLNKQQKKYIKACDSKELRKLFKKFFKKENRAWIELKNQEIVFKNNMFTTDNPFIIEFLNGLSVTQLEKTTETPCENTLTKETLESLTNPKICNACETHKATIGDKCDSCYGVLIHAFSQFKNHPDLMAKSNELDKAIDEHLEKENDKKTLEFDLPKKGNIKEIEINKEKDFFISPFIISNRNDINNDEFFEQVTNMAKLYDAKLIKEFAEYSPPAPNKIKKYTEKDMLNCFNESRLTHPMVGFKHDSFDSYLESLK